MSTPATPGPRILVADDTASRAAIVDVLRTAGHVVLESTDAESTAALVREQRPDLVLLAVALPGARAAGIVRRIAADRTKGDDCVVLLLGGPDDDPLERAAAIDAGAVAVISMSASNAELLALVGRHLERQRALVDARSSEERFRELIARQAGAVMVVDASGEIRYLNPAAGVVLGRGTQRLPADGLDVAIPQGGPHELVLRGSDGALPVVEMQVTSMRWEGEEASLIAFRDVTEQRHAMDRLAAREAHYRAVVERAGDAVVLMDDEGVLVEANPAAGELLGRPAADLVGSSLLEFVQAVDDDRDLDAVWERFLDTGDLLGVARIHRADAAIREAEFHARADVTPGRHLSIMHDITERLAAERLARDRSTLLSTAQRIARMGSWQVDLASGHVTWGPETLELFGFDPDGPPPSMEEVMARVEPDDRPAISEAQREADERGPFRAEYRLRRPDGDVRWMLSRGVVERDERGPVTRLGMVMDVTELKRTEAELRRTTEDLEQREALLKVASRLNRIGAWRIDLAHGGVTWSEELRALLERPDESTPDLGGFFDLFTPEHVPVIRDACERCGYEGTPFDEELRIVTPGGRGAWVRLIGEAVLDEEGRIIAIQGALQDIDERKVAEARERSLEERLAVTLEGMSDAFILLDREWRFRFVNREAERIMRRPRASLEGRVLWDEFPDTVGSEFERRYRQAVMTGETTVFEAEYPPLGLLASVSAYPLPDGLAIYFRDVTVQRAMEEQLHQSQRLEAVGQLTGGVAHDFNNLLTVIMGNTELLLEELAGDPDRQELAELTMGAARRGAELTQRLLAFARRQALAPRVVDANELVGSMDGLLRRTLGEHIEIEFTRAGGLWPALVDASQLEGAVLNLALNARDAMPDGGRLTIETGNARLDDEYASSHADVVAGQYVMVAVSDTGTGIAPEHLEQVFDPFFTTKEAGRGTGLGLSMVYGFVKQSAGHVRIYSEPGAGTTVRMYLPRAISGSGGGGREPVVAAVGGDETILLVEDDALVRRYVRDQLLGLGYRVLVASSATEALERLRVEPGVDLLFTDVVMPGMNGRQLADTAREARPELRVLFTSGYTEDAIVHHGRLDPGVQLLSKPYRRGDLARAIRRALER